MSLISYCFKLRYPSSGCCVQSDPQGLIFSCLPNLLAQIKEVYPMIIPQVFFKSRLVLPSPNFI
jgi:hypothetical protein